jgi:hypothetical protein
MGDQAFGPQLPGGKEAHTVTADGDRAGAEFSGYTFPLPSDGTAAIATCTSLENACCLHAFEDADMVKGQGEWRLMMQIGCKCPPHKQDLFLQHVRGFGARVVPGDWHQQLMVVGAGGLAEEEGGRWRQNAEEAAAEAEAEVAAEAVSARARCEQLLMTE